MIEAAIHRGLPAVISILELFGIFVVTFSACGAFWHYLRTLLQKGRRFDVRHELAAGMTCGLEFKMAAEILKTVLVHTAEELAILAAIILLRALLSLILHWELRAEGKAA